MGEDEPTKAVESTRPGEPGKVGKASEPSAPNDPSTPSKLGEPATPDEQGELGESGEPNESGEGKMPNKNQKPSNAVEDGDEDGEEEEDKGKEAFPSVKRKTPPGEAIPSPMPAVPEQPALVDECIDLYGPCRILLAETDSAPWKFRDFTAMNSDGSAQACCEGMRCVDRDIAAVSYYTDTDETTEKPSSIFYCTK